MFYDSVYDNDESNNDSRIDNIITNLDNISNINTVSNALEKSKINDIEPDEEINTLSKITETTKTTETIDSDIIKHLKNIELELQELKKIKLEVQHLKNIIIKNKYKPYNNSIILLTKYTFNDICNMVNFQIELFKVNVKNYNQYYIYVEFINHILCDAFIIAIRNFNKHCINHDNKIFYYMENNNRKY